MLPGNVYALTPGPSPISEDVPARDGAENATNAKGRLRHTLEARLQAAAQAGQCRALVVRAGDFFGAHAPRGWMAQAMLPALNRPEWPAVPGAGVPPTVRRIWQPGQRDGRMPEAQRHYIMNSCPRWWGVHQRRI